MRVSILTEAGKNIGFGHLTRCIALYQAFQEKDNNPKLIINGDESVLRFVKDKKYQMLNWLEEKEELMGIAKSSDAVVMDSYLAPKSLYENISSILYSQQPKSLLMIDDYKRIDYPKGIVVNPSIYGDKLDYPKNDQVEYLLGKDYIILRKEFWDVPEKKINKEVNNVLIVLGGSQSRNTTGKIANLFKENFKLNVNIAGSEKSKLSAAEMLELMLKADICISGGGQITYELARVGVPTASICFAENQRINLMALNDLSVLKFIGLWNDGDILVKLEDWIRTIISDSNARLELNRKSKNLIDGLGVKRIMEFMYP